MYFQKSHSLLDRFNIPRLEDYKFTPIIKGVDLIKSKNEGLIEFREDGVYYFKNGNWIRGFFYMYDYNISRYDTFPKMHLYECETIKKRNLFYGTYIWSNNKTVEVKDTGSGKVYKNQELKTCYNCTKINNENIRSSVEFYDSIKNDESETVVSEKVGILGYPTNHRKLATNYKRRSENKCQSCSIVVSESKFLDVDHINGYNKSDYSDSNLQLLCKLCHTYKDEYHLNKAMMYPNRNHLLHIYVNEYRNKGLEANPYLNRYFVDFKKI